MTYVMPDQAMLAPNGNPVPVPTVDARFHDANCEQVRVMCVLRGELQALDYLGISA